MTTPPPSGQQGQPGQPEQPYQPGQTYQPGNPFSQQAADSTQGPVYGQQPPAGGYAPVPGAPGHPTPPPSGSQSSKAVSIIVGVVAVVVLIVAVVGYLAFRDGGDDGEDIDSTPVGSCITAASGELSKVETKAIDCADTAQLSYVVGSKASSSEGCQAQGLQYSITEYGTGASDDVLCLMPNYIKGSCYEESSISMGLGLEPVACSEESTIMNAVYKITERVESASVPNCTDAATQKTLTATIQSDPPRAIGVCAEIQGDYTWEE